MIEMTLHYPVKTLEDQLLFPPGTLLTEETLNAVVDSHRAYSYPTCPLLSYGSVREDYLNFLTASPYAAILYDKKEMNDLLALLETVHFPIPILESLAYFKHHDPYTYAHVLLVLALSILLAKDLIPGYRESIQLSATGPTHDIGKICVPLHVLKKATPLTRAERSSLEHHAAASYVLLSYYFRDLRNLACRVGLEHHERRDGSGYPRGIRLEDPMVEIVAVSDIYDALIKPRPYRSAPFENRTALEEITKMAEQNKIGWNVVKALVARNRKSKPSFREITISAEKRGAPPVYNAYGIIVEGDKTDPKDRTGS